MTHRHIAVAALALLATPAIANDIRPPGRETVISFAANGGIRQLEPGPVGSAVIYLRDRTEAWYRVTLSGPCLPDRSLESITYTTDPAGTFDRFSTIRSRRYPERSCGVASIVGSAPPASVKRPPR